MPRVTDKPSVTVTFIKGEDPPDSIKAVIQITSKQITINPVDNGEKQIYQRSAFRPVQPPDDGLVLAFKKKFFGVEAIKLAGDQRVLREIHEKLSDPAKAPKPVKHISPKEIVMPNDNVVDTLKAAIETLPQYPGMLTHRSLLYSYIYLEGCKGKPQNLTLHSKKALTSLCKKRMDRAYGQLCGKEQMSKRSPPKLPRRGRWPITPAVATSDAEEWSSLITSIAAAPVFRTPFKTEPLEDPFGGGDRNEDRGGEEDQNMDDEPGGGDSDVDAMTDEAAHAVEALENEEMDEDTEGQFHINVDMDVPWDVLPDNFDLAHDADNEVLEEQAPVMRQRPQKHEAPKKDMEKMKQMEKHFLSESSSEESDEITITRPTKQRTLSVSCSDDSFPTKLTAKRQRPLPPPLPKRRKKPVDNNKSGEVVENQKKQRSGPVEEARTGVNDADTASTVSNDVLQQAMDESGVSEMGMEPSGEGEVRVGAFNDSHAEEGVVETEMSGVAQDSKITGAKQIRRKMIHEGEFLDKKAKLFKISVQKLEEAQDIMSEMTFAPAVGLADQLIEHFLSIVTILNIIGILFQKPAPLMPPSHFMQPCFQCSKCDEVFPSHLYDAHLLTPKHLRLTRSTNAINLEAGEENQAEGEDPTTPPPMTGMKKEEVMDPGYGNPHPTIDVVDLTADEEEVTAGLEFLDSVTF